MSLQNTSKSVLRVGKNYIKGYTDTQKKVRDATSNEPWGPSGEQMNAIAQLSYNQNDFIEMMEIMDKRLNDKGKNWRHVFKTLTLLDYLLHAGSENCVIYFRDNIYVVKTLREFQYIDDYGKDQGANVRQKAKDITNLLMDDQRLREERRSRASMRSRMAGDDAPPISPANFEDDEGRRRRAEAERRRSNRQNQEDEELKKAIEESKRMARENEERIRREATNEDELQKALALSREEEEKRIKELEQRNQNALFDDDFNLIDGPPNQYAQGQDQWAQQQQYMQPQFTSFNPYMMQAQQTGYNPFLQQQMALQQQQEAEYQRQMELQMAAQQYQHVMTQPQPLQPQPTAFRSNNPFAFGQPQPQPQPQQQQQLFQQPQQQTPQQVPTGDLLGGESASAPSSQPAQAVQTPPPQQQQQQGPPRVKISDKYADLDRLLASGEAQDTFGNVGAQAMGHTQGRMQYQQTGNANGQNGSASNPFFKV